MLSTRMVEGCGPTPCSIMVCGEAPGEREDREGKPFVGRSGQLLTEALRLAGVSRDSIYITNIVKSRPPENRRPTREEISAHIPFLIQEIASVQPDYVLLLGNTALFAVTMDETGISKRRGVLPTDQSFFPAHVLVYATYHPSAALRSKETKEIFLKDVKTFIDLTRVRTEEQKGALSNMQ